MLKYIFKRILYLIPILLGVSIIIFALKTFTPGDPARQILGNSATEKQVEEKREELGLNDPVYQQYFNYVKGIVTKEDVEKLENGVKIEDYTSGKAKVKILKTDEEKQFSRVQITIHEGKNRQVRKMCEAVNRKVLALHRSKIGGIGVKDIELGKWRYLRENEIQKLVK